MGMGVLSSGIYLDNAASTAMAPAVVAAIAGMAGEHANPSAPHRRGRRARIAVNRVREQLADLFAASARNVIFTSGATEAINMVFMSVPTCGNKGDVVLVAPTEHKAVLQSATHLSSFHGLGMEFLPVNSDGLIDAEALHDRLADGGVAMVAVMAVNNETGVIQPVVHIAELCQSVNMPYLCDTSQAVGKTEIDATCIDFAVVSAHKVHGPTGIGALISPNRAAGPAASASAGGSPRTWIACGNHEPARSCRPRCGSEYVQSAEESVQAVSERFLNTLRAKCPRPVTVNAEGAPRVPHIVNLRIDGVDADTLLCSRESGRLRDRLGCNSDLPVPSHVLLAMGLTDDQARASVRLSFSRFTALDEAEQAALSVADEVANIVAMEADESARRCFVKRRCTTGVTRHLRHVIRG